MKEPREDDERLSALLEGRVEGRQREELLAHLAEADDDYEVFTNTASVLRALEEEDARGRPSVAPPSMRRRPWPAARTLAVAGTVVLLLAVGWLFRGRSSSVTGDPVQLAMNLEMDTVDWSPWTPDGGVRGLESQGAKRQRAVFAGARLVDLAVVVRSGNAARIHEEATSLQSKLDFRTDPNAALSYIAANPGASVDSLNALLKEATNNYAAELDREALEVGAWLEAARLATVGENANFFAGGTSEGMLRRAERLARGDAQAEAAVVAVRESLRGRGPSNWEVRGNRLDALLSRLVRMKAPGGAT